MVLNPISEFNSPEFKSRKDAENYMNDQMKAYKEQGYYFTLLSENVYHSINCQQKHKLYN